VKRHPRHPFLALATLVLLSACGEAAGDDATAQLSTGGVKPSSGGGAPAATGGAAQLGSGGSSPTSSAGTTSAPANQDGLPCGVRTILRERCSMCHGATPQFGAAFSLVSAADVRTHGAQMEKRIADDQKPMPPPPNARLTADQRSALAQYIDAGAPTSTCGEADPVASDPDPIDMPTKPTDPNVTCYNLTARSSKANDKYVVPTTPDLYHCFNFAPPWGSKKVQLVSSRPIIDNARVLHHWLVYNGEATVQDGTHSDCAGAHPNTALVAGWAPGGQAFEAPPDVGVELANGGFVLETHYNNTVGEGQQDASGVEVCVTDKPRPNVAAMHWLGTELLNKVEASGTCHPTNTGDVTILRSSPHMHLQGRHMKTVINRAGGGTDVLIDQAFDFNTQISYSTPAVVHKGDTLTTTCTYATPTAFGEGTNNEMCYNFVLAYPAGGLAQSLQVLRKYDCAGLF
jgi:hypothetical protein